MAEIDPIQTERDRIIATINDLAAEFRHNLPVQAILDILALAVRQDRRRNKDELMEMYEQRMAAYRAQMQVNDLRANDDGQ